MHGRDRRDVRSDAAESGSDPDGRGPRGVLERRRGSPPTVTADDRADTSVGRGVQ